MPIGVLEAIGIMVEYVFCYRSECATIDLALDALSKTLDLFEVGSEKDGSQASLDREDPCAPSGGEGVLVEACVQAQSAVSACLRHRRSG